MPVDLRDFYERNKTYFGDKPLADVAQEAYQKSGAADTHSYDQWLDWTGVGRQQIEEDRFNRLPRKDGSTLGALARTAGRIPENLVAKGIQALQGQSGASVTNRGLADQYVNWVEKRNRDLAQEYSGSGDVPLTGGIISKKDVAALGPDLSYSGLALLGSMYGGAKGAVIGAPLGPVGAAVGGIAGGLAAPAGLAHRMTGYQTMNDWLEKKNQESIKNTGVGITPEQEAQYRTELESSVTKSSAWEAGPQAVGTMLEKAIMKTPMGRIMEILPKGIKGKVMAALLRATGLLASELPTEAVTQMGQQRTESEAGMSTEAPRQWDSVDDWLKSAKEVFPAVLLQTGAMSVGGAAYRKLAGIKPGQQADAVDGNIRHPSGIASPNWADQPINGNIPAPPAPPPPSGPITRALQAGGISGQVVPSVVQGQQVPPGISSLTGMQPTPDQAMPGQEFQPVGMPSTAEQAAQVLAGKQTPAIDSAFAMQEQGIDSPYYPELDDGQGVPSDPKPKDIKELSLESLQKARPAFEARNRPDILSLIDAEIQDKTNRVPEHLRQVFGIMGEEINVNKDGMESLKQTEDGEFVGRASNHPQWFKDLNRDAENGIDVKTFNALLKKKESGQSLTDRQAEIWKNMQDAAEKYNREHPDTVISLDEARIKKMGYEPNHGQPVALTNINIGDRLLFDGEEFEAKGFDVDGNMVFKDGDIVKVDPFETVSPDGIKRVKEPKPAGMIKEAYRGATGIQGMVESRRDVLAEDARMQKADAEPRGPRGMKKPDIAGAAEGVGTKSAVEPANTAQAGEQPASTFAPAFRDEETGKIYPALVSSGKPSGTHSYEFLPEDVVTQRDANGDVAGVKSSLAPGFVKDGKFYTRDEAVEYRNKEGMQNGEEEQGKKQREAEALLTNNEPGAALPESVQPRQKLADAFGYTRLANGKFRISRNGEAVTDVDSVNAAKEYILGNYPVYEKYPGIFVGKEAKAIPESAAAPGADQKQHWEMTEKEHSARIKNLPIEDVRRELIDALKQQRGWTEEKATKYVSIGGGDRAVKDLHNSIVPIAAVEQALSENKPVPSDVLAQYPGLKKRADQPRVETVTPPSGKAGAAPTEQKPAHLMTRDEWGELDHSKNVKSKGRDIYYQKDGAKNNDVLWVINARKPIHAINAQHLKEVSEALKSGTLSPADYTRLHEKDYGPIEKFTPGVVKDSVPAEPTIQESLKVPPVGTLVSNGTDTGKVYFDSDKNPRVRLASGRSVKLTAEWAKPAERAKAEKNFIGINPNGDKLYQDEKGKRYRLNDAGTVRLNEPVRVVMSRTGISGEIDRADKPEWQTVEELAKQTSQSAPETQPEARGEAQAPGVVQGEGVKNQQPKIITDQEAKRIDSLPGAQEYKAKAVKAIDQKIKDANDNIKDWQSRRYKENDGSVYVGSNEIEQGDTPWQPGEKKLNIGRLNEKKRAGRIQAYRDEVKELEELKNKIGTVDDSNAHRFTSELFHAVTGRDVLYGEPQFNDFANELKANLKAKENRGLTQKEYDGRYTDGKFDPIKVMMGMQPDPGYDDFLLGKEKPIEAQPAATPAAAYGANNKLVSIDQAQAARDRIRKKLGQLNVGMDPELMSDGMTIAVFHIEAGARQFKDYAQKMIADFGDSIKPFLKSFYSAAREYPGLDNSGMDSYEKVSEFDVSAIGEEAGTGKPESDIAQWVSGRFETGKTFTWRELFGKADETYGGTQSQGKYTPKDAYDAMELGVNQFILKNKRGMYDPRMTISQAQFTVQGIKARVNSILPTQTKRTAEQDEFQQFSTPPHHAFVANWVANITPADVVLEPSAGVGGLAAFAKNAGATVYVNELSPRRADLLETMGFEKVFRENAEQINNILPSNIKPTVIIMNPPFSSTAGRVQGQRKTMNATKHIEQALARLAPGGRLVAIVGEGMREGAPTFKDWWTKIKGQYSVRANIGINGAEYAKYGTTFNQQILIIDKLPGNAYNTITGNVDKVEDLLPLLNEVRDGRKQIGDKSVVGETSKEGQADTRPESASLPPVGDVGGGIRGAGLSEKAGASGMASSASGLGTQEGDGPAGGRGKLRPPDKDRGRLGRPGRSGVADSGAVGQSVDSDNAGLPGTGIPEELRLEAVKKEARGEITESLFESYSPEKINVPGSKRHPTPLVQSAAMSAVSPPTPKHRPKIPQAAISKGKISDIQIETVIYAGEAHSDTLPSGERKGFFIGDGTGVGKGREIAGIFWDNWMNGRTKGVWISEKNPLVQDAQRDISGVGWDPKILIEHGKVKATDSISASKGILFTTYDTVKSASKQKGTVDAKSRLDQIISWLGKDFDGVIAFDESHNMGNAIAVPGSRGMTKPSAKALAGIDLQRKLPNARIVYISATGATDVVNLAYCDRLGLWGEGTPFPGKKQFISEISKGGTATMEMVAQNMKASGVYTSRSLSYDGVKYDRIEHVLSPQQRDVYDKLAEGWQVILRNINTALELTGVTAEGGNGETITKNSAQKSAAMSAFWGSHQRFFNQVITAMQTPAVINKMHKDLKKGEAVVIQLVNTMEASLERSLSKMVEGDSLDDLDMTPRDSMMQLIQNSFPVQMYEDYTDEDGNLKSRPVVDSEGKRVENPEAVALRERLMDELGSVKVPDSPIDMILNEFGVDNVAEITGRKRRVVKKKAENGAGKVIEKRTKLAITAEADAFMDGKRDILIFSQAGGTGRSYHADLDAKNQKKRNHYLLQAGWRADSAVQGLGRSHRSNQKQPPAYFLVTTDLKGQKRFLSSIARRLDQLGALTKGQRETGSQGIFQARDNLESDYAKDALQVFFRDLKKGRIDGLSIEDFENETGLNLTNEAGGVLADLPPIKQFLNRILSMKIDSQNRAFDAFSERMDQVIQHHAQQGTLDVGLESITAKKIEKVDEQVVYTDPKTKAKTRYINLKLTHNQRFANFPEGKKIVVNKKSGKVWSVGISRERTNSRTGEIETVIDLMSPTYTHKTMLDSELSNERWDTVPYADKEKVWQQSIDATPKTFTADVHLVSGLLLPIWDRLIGWPKLVRVQTDSGERMIGRLIDEDNLSETLIKLGANQKPIEISNNDLHSKILDEGYSVELSNGWAISKKIVSGEPRIELKGPYYANDDVLKKYGVFIERINWNTRYFVPTDNAGVDVLAKVVQYNPVVKISGGSRQSQQPDIVYSDTATAPTEKLPGRVTVFRVKSEFKALIDKVNAKGDISFNVGRDPSQIASDSLRRAVMTHEKQTGKVVKAFFHKKSGTLYVFTDRMSSMKDVAATVAHELVGHHGLYEFMGSDLQPFLDFVNGHEKYGQEIKATAARRGYDMGTQEGRDKAAKEWFAETVERGEIKPSLWTRFVVAFKNALREMGFKSEWLVGFSDKDVAEIIRGSMRAVEGKGRQYGQAVFGQRAMDYQDVFHGTPHVWPPEPGFPHGRPRLDKIGTGEGAAAYGWGWYSADVKETAKSYQDSARWDALKKQPNNDITQTAQQLEAGIPESEVRDGMLDLGIPKERHDDIIRDAKKLVDNIGATYKLDIPDSVVGKLLDWDKKLSEQPSIINGIKKAFLKRGFNESQIKSMLDRDITGEQAYVYLGGIRGEKVASETLASIGIPGNKYLDGMSRGKGAGSFNYVIWDQPTLDKIALLERNGEKLNAIRGQESQMDYSMGGEQASDRAVTQTPAFLKWFGDSKVVDSEGKPLVVYHGTRRAGFEAFSMNMSDMGSHFTPIPSVASFAAGDGPAEGYVSRGVYPVYLSIKNPIRLIDEGGWDLYNVLPQLEKMGVATKKDIEEVENTTISYTENMDRSSAGGRALREFLQKKGYDGVVYLNRREILSVDEKVMPAERWAKATEGKTRRLPDAEFKSKIPEAEDSYIALQPEQIKSVFNRGTFSPTDPRIDFSDASITGEDAPIHDYLKARETAAAKGSTKWKEPRADISQVDMLFKQMLYYAPKVPALKKMYDAAGKYLESKTGKQRDILYAPDGKTSYTKELERIEKEHKEQFGTLGKYLVTLDMAAKGYKVKQKDEHTEGGGIRRTFILVAPREDWKEGTFSTEKEAWAAAIEYEAEAYAKFHKAAHPDIVKALTIFRAIGHNMYDMLHQSMETMIEEYEKAGKPLPEFSFEDASTGKKVRMTLQKAMAEMGDIRGSYFPRTRKPGAFTLIAKKEDQNPILEKFDIALTYKNEDSWQSKIPLPINLRAAELKKQGYDVTMMKSDALPESVFLELSGQSIALESLLTHAFDQLNANQEHSLKDMGIKSKWDGDDFLIYGEGIHKKSHPAILQHLGGKYKYVQKKGQEGYPSVRFENAKETIADEVKDILLKHAQSTFVDTMFGNSLITTLADIFKARGGRSGMVARHKGVGVEVWKGYEEDPVIAFTRASLGIAGATAKGELAKQLHGIITGRTESWAEYQQRIVDTTPATQASYAEYQKAVEARKISATKQPNAYKLAQSYTQSLLRNDEAVDRIVGVAGGLAVLKYLWGRPGAVFVNLTNMAAGVPGSMKGHAGIPINKSFGLIGKAGVAYKNYKFGDGASLDKWTLSTLEHIEKSGWDQAQYNQEAMAPLKGKFGRAFEKVMELGMLGFSVSEKINRVSTILGTYLGIKEMHKGPWNQVAHEAALEKAKEVSDKAHGVYGDVNRPYLAQGGGVAGNLAKSFFMFKTFSHNYVLNMIELGFKKEIKAMSYLALAPAIMAGASATVLAPFIKAACMAFGVDDPEEEFYAWMEKEMGAGSAMYARTGLLGMGGNGPALKGSLSIGITDLPTSISDILGAPAGIVKDLAAGAQAIGRGDLVKGFEKALPNSLAGPIRAYRESTEGLTTSSNAPRFFGDKQVKLTGYEAAMRALSFNPARIAVIQDIQRSEYKAKEMLQKQRHEIYLRARRAILDQDQDEYADVLARMNRYNLAVKGNERYEGYPLLTWKKILMNVRKSQKPSKTERNRQTEL